MAPRRQQRKPPDRRDARRPVSAGPNVRPHEPKPPKPKRKKASEKAIFIWAEGQQESGGYYGAVNSSSGALGRWQVMPDNLPGWLARSGLPDMTPAQYLANHKAQDRLAWVILGGDYDRYGPRGAASVWYSGQPDWHATYGNPPVYQYVADVIAIMKEAGGRIPPDQGIGSRQAGNPVNGNIGVPPKPGKEDWSPHVIRTRNSFADTSRTIDRHTQRMNQLQIRR